MLVSKKKIIDIFCGIGGFSRGFLDLNYDVLLGIDIWDKAILTFKKNHDKSEAIKEDVSKIPNSFFSKFRNKIDVIISGPPCQGFSMSGKRDPNDKRNSLFNEVIRITKYIKPKFVIIENVPGLKSMKTHNGYPIDRLIVESFKEIKYSVTSKILNAADFGVPQLRKRVFFIASSKKEFTFPKPTHCENNLFSGYNGEFKKWITTGEALGDIPDIGKNKYLKPQNEFQKKMSNCSDKILNHYSMKHSKMVIKRMSMVPHGGNWTNIPKKFYNIGGEHSNNYKRLDPKKPAITIKHAIKSMIIHPKFNRCLTPREVARLQGFDNLFELIGTKSDQHQLLANAVPPAFGNAFAKKIKELL